ncbi:MAG TPA: PAS-domain containing protein [Acetobacteraceae bacterium]|nr:PAS-domain containing protein [Acetobacteraceae bacterium]
MPGLASAAIVLATLAVIGLAALGTDADRVWAVAIAGALALLFALLAAVSLGAFAAVRRRSRALAHEEAELRNANARLAVAKAEAEAKTVQLEGMLANMSDGVSLFDSEFRIRQWNDLFFERTGVPRELLRIGMTIEEILRIQAGLGEFGPGDIEEEIARRMVNVRDLTHLGVRERLRPNGTTIELRRSLMPDGGFVTLYADITARREAEAARRLAQEAAEAAVAAKAEFVATVAHEVRSPLNAVINSLDLLAASGLPPAQRKLAEAAHGAGDALRTLITDLLDIARIDAGRFRLAPEDFALHPLLQAIAEMFHSQAEARGLAITLDLAPDLPDRLHADPRRLRQVLLNFLSNAVKFSRPGTITLSAAIAEEDSSRRVLLAVTDPGPSISAEDRARLFQPFERLDAASASGLPGSGLGLAISQRLALLMGGAIGCEVAEGGNRFWIAIPLAPAHEETDAASSAEPILGHRRLPRSRVLIVEDVPANQLILATTLRRDGHLVDIAGSGETALDALRLTPYDIAFLDLHLPGINGLETARRIRQSGGPAAAMPLVGLTASVSADSQARCLEAGMNDVLGKPVTNTELTRALAGQLQPLRQARRGAAAEPPAPASIDADRLATLREELPPGLLTMLAEQCLTDIAARLPNLRAALEAGQAEEAASVAHTVAGTAATYGLGELASLARALWAAAREGNTDPGPMASIEAEYREGAAALRALLAR